MVELLGPVIRVAGLIPVSWSSAKRFGLETLSTIVALILCLINNIYDMYGANKTCMNVNIGV